MKVTKTLLPLILLFVLSLYSCQKDFTPIDPTPLDSTVLSGIKDSTLLIKSIYHALHDSTTGEILDSGTQYYLYDTVAKKVYATTRPINGPVTSLDRAEFSYNNSGLLTRIDYKYVTGTPDTGSLASSQLNYDASSILQSATVTFVSGSAYSIPLNKTALPAGGYKLSWLDTNPNNGNGVNSNTASFDSKGLLLAYSQGSGGVTNSSDSLVYDAGGNISKQIQREYFYLNPPYTQPDSISTYTLYDFISRDTRGNQLYTFNQLLYNGIANFPNSLSDNLAGLGNVDETILQYTKYPALASKIRRVDQSTGYIYQSSFNSAPQYDSRNRLTKYNLFFNDYQLMNTDYTISYYKQ